MKNKKSDPAARLRRKPKAAPIPPRKEIRVRMYRIGDHVEFQGDGRRGVIQSLVLHGGVSHYSILWNGDEYAKLFETDIIETERYRRVGSDNKIAELQHAIEIWRDMPSDIRGFIMIGLEENGERAESIVNKVRGLTERELVHHGASLKKDPDSSFVDDIQDTAARQRLVSVCFLTARRILGAAAKS